MFIQQNSFNAGSAGAVRQTSAAAANPHYLSSAVPNSLASIVRSNIVVRDSESPISFPFAVEEAVGYYRRAG